MPLREKTGEVCSQKMIETRRSQMEIRQHRQYRAQYSPPPCCESGSELESWFAEGRGSKASFTDHDAARENVVVSREGQTLLGERGVRTPYSGVILRRRWDSRDGCEVKPKRKGKKEKKGKRERLMDG